LPLVGFTTQLDNLEVLLVEAFLSLVAAQIIILLFERLLGRARLIPVRT